MDYQVRYSDLDAMDGDFRAQMAKWSEALSEINGKTKALVGTSNMSGNTADNMRSYFSGVYGSILAGLNAAMVSFQNNWLLYRQDYRNIDGADNTVIITSEIESLGQALIVYQGQKEYVETEVRNAVASVSDISHASFNGIEAVYAIHNEICNKLTQLMSKVDSLESSHASGDFGQIDQTIQSLKSLVIDMLGKNTIYKTQFSEVAFAASKAYQGLVSAYDAIVADMEGKSELIEAATIGEKAHFENLEKRAAMKHGAYDEKKVMGDAISCSVHNIISSLFDSKADQPIIDFTNILGEKAKKLDGVESVINKANSLLNGSEDDGYSWWKEIKSDYSAAKKVIESFGKAETIYSNLRNDGGSGFLHDELDSWMKAIQSNDPMIARDQIKKITNPLGKISGESGLSKTADIAYAFTVDGKALNNSTSYHTIDDIRKIQSAEKGMYELGRAVGGSVATIVDAALNTVPGLNLDIPTSTVVQIADETGSWFGAAGNMIDSGINEIRRWMAH